MNHNDKEYEEHAALRRALFDKLYDLGCDLTDLVVVVNNTGKQFDRVTEWLEANKA